MFYVAFIVIAAIKNRTNQHFLKFQIIVIFRPIITTTAYCQQTHRIYFECGAQSPSLDSSINTNFHVLIFEPSIRIAQRMHHSTSKYASSTGFLLSFYLSCSASLLLMRCCEFIIHLYVFISFLFIFRCELAVKRTSAVAGFIIHYNRRHHRAQRSKLTHILIGIC